MSNFWKDKKVVVTGGSGFLGSRIVALLESAGASNIFVPRSKEYDLRDLDPCRKVASMGDVIIHAAGFVGGIGLNRERPGQLFYDNIVMGVQLMEEARKAGALKFVSIGTVCAYPKFTPIPFKEDDLWMGYPEETNAAYGLAKKMLLVQGQAYRQQYGFNAIFLLPVNLYGPGDSFDAQSAHVIPDLIRKFIDAKIAGSEEVVLFGTGTPTREFLYVEDCAKAIVLASELYDKAEPVNIGSAFEISIKDLAQKIKGIVGFEGEIVWDRSKPDGQPRRKLDVSRAKEEFGFESVTDFDEGLRETIRWYLENALSGLSGVLEGMQGGSKGAADITGGRTRGNGPAYVRARA